MAQNVIFKIGTREQFDAIVTKNPNALYWLSDTQELYKGDVLFGKGSLASETAAGLLSAEDYKKLKELIATSGTAGLTPVDGTISIDNGKIGVKVSKSTGNLIAVHDDGLFVAVESVSIDQVTGLEERLTAIEQKVVDGIRYCGSVDTVADLPADAAQGDLYEVLEDNSEWCFNGEKWFEYGRTVDFSPIAGEGIKIDGKTISVNIAEESHGLIAVDGAMSIALATAQQDGAMSKEDKAFIDSIPTTYATISGVNDLVNSYMEQHTITEKVTALEESVAAMEESFTWGEM